MQLQSLFVLATGLTSVLAAPALSKRDNTWTLENFQRTCSGTSCRYQYVIRDNTDGAGGACDYTVSSNVYQSQQCGPGSPYYINQGYNSVDNDSPNSYIVVVPVHVPSSKDAFFGYTLAELGNGAPVTPDKSSPINSM